MVTRAEFVAVVRSYVGTPYHHQGRLPGVGLDCAGVLICAAWACGVKPAGWDVNGYARQPDGETLRRICDEHLTAIDPAAMRAADVLLVRFRRGPPQHLGIVFDHPRGGLSMVHADGLRSKSVSETRVEFGRAMSLVAAYSVPGLE